MYNVLMENNLANLVHQSSPIQGGGEVIVLNIGATIDAESSAMLQALHSRSTGGLRGHLDILAKRGSENFMKNFYVGYGHKSIGDCGNAILFIEGVSMLAAKAIQDWPLYSGQEASTRYVDFQTQPFHDPSATPGGAAILEEWRAFYVRSMEPTVEHLKAAYPLGEGEDAKIYEKAIRARAFDVLRGFLPAGATTNLAWSTNLRQAADKLMMLRHHPLNEVRNIADAIESALQKAFPNSFGHKQYETTEEYNRYLMQHDYYYHDTACPDFSVTDNSVRSELLPRESLERRPAKTELPRHLLEAGTVQFEFLLDFGSFRDLQRHRAVTQRMPLLTTELGFEPWYFSELPETVTADARATLAKQETAIATLSVTIEERQYYIAMGYRTSNRLTGGLPALAYLVELRATRFVHPTLRKRAKEMADALTSLFAKDGLVLHLDAEIDRFDIKRGEHDIILK